MRKIYSFGFLTILLFANLNCSAGNKTFTAPYSGAVVDRYSSNPNRFLVIDTKQGMIKIQLFDKVAPNHVTQITKLAEEGKYNETTFHRIIAGSLIQGGDPNSKDNDQSNDGIGGMGGQLNAEFNQVSFMRGVCGMALGSNNNSASSQFFICVKDHAGWNGHYSAWGQVVDGYATLDSIASLANSGKYSRTSDGSANPGKDAIMVKVFVEEQK